MKKIIMMILVTCFTYIANAQVQSEGYKAAQEYCRAFGQKPSPGTNQNHAFQYNSSDKAKTSNTGAQNSYGVNGGGDVRSSKVAKKIAEVNISAGGNVQRTGKRTDTERTKSGTTTEYYNCK